MIEEIMEQNIAYIHLWDSTTAIWLYIGNELVLCYLSPTSEMLSINYKREVCDTLQHTYMEGVNR